MINKLKIHKLKAQSALLALGKIFRSPKYVALSLTSSFLISSLIVWSLNLGLLKFIIFESGLSVAKKSDFFFSGFTSIFETFGTYQAIGVILFALLFGLNIVLMVYVIKNQGLKSIPKKSSSGAMFFAVLSGGCVACGTSIIAPLLATFGATSAPFVRELTALFTWAGSFLILYSIIKLGGIAATIQAKANSQ